MKRSGPRRVGGREGARERALEEDGCLSLGEGGSSELEGKDVGCCRREKERRARTETQMHTHTH